MLVSAISREGPQRTLIGDAFPFTVGTGHSAPASPLANRMMRVFLQEHISITRCDFTFLIRAAEKTF
jgi:hypothetical protein